MARATKGLWLLLEEGDMNGEVFTNARYLTESARYLVTVGAKYTIYDLETAAVVPVKSELTVTLDLPTTGAKAAS